MSKKEDKFREHGRKLNELHKKIEVGCDHLLQHMLEAGGMLIEVKEELPHGQFMKWVEKNCDFSGSTARRYMRVHRGLQLGVTMLPSGNTTHTSAAAVEALLREDDSILEPKQKKGETAPAPREPEPPAFEEEQDGEEYTFETPEEMAEAGIAPEESAPEAAPREQKPAPKKREPKKSKKTAAPEEPKPRENIGLALSVRTLLRDLANDYAGCVPLLVDFGVAPELRVDWNPDQPITTPPWFRA